MQEPILTDHHQRWNLFPIKYNTAYEMYNKHIASFWTVGEVDLEEDRTHWKTKLTENERNFIRYTLAFFAASDGIVNENLVQSFCSEVTIPELRLFYGFQIGMETIHQVMYGTMIETLEPEKEQQNKLFNAVNDCDPIRAKALWALKWMDNEDATFAQRLIGFACVEGIFFSASFCSIFYFKKRGLMPGLSFSNELISRDEGLHRDFACYVYSLLEHTRLDQEKVHDIISSAVNCENGFVELILSNNLIGINSDSMKIYVKYVADHLAVSLGYEKIYNVKNPFEWMDLISLPGKTNFFEKRVGEYQKDNVFQKTDPKNLSFDADF